MESELSAVVSSLESLDSSTSAVNSSKGSDCSVPSCEDEFRPDVDLATMDENTACSLSTLVSPSPSSPLNQNVQPQLALKLSFTILTRQ